jgi:hypothetical protein
MHSSYLLVFPLLLCNILARLNVKFPFLYLQTKRHTRNNPCESNGSVKAHGPSGGQPGSDKK